MVFFHWVSFFYVRFYKGKPSRRSKYFIYRIISFSDFDSHTDLQYSEKKLFKVNNIFFIE